MLFDWLQTEPFESPNVELISISRILPAFSNFFISLYLHKPFQTKGKNEIKKAITNINAQLKNVTKAVDANAASIESLREVLKDTSEMVHNIK